MIRVSFSPLLRNRQDGTMSMSAEVCSLTRFVFSVYCWIWCQRPSHGQQTLFYVRLNAQLCKMKHLPSTVDGRSELWFIHEAQIFFLSYLFYLLIETKHLFAVTLDLHFPTNTSILSHHAAVLQGMKREFWLDAAKHWPADCSGQIGNVNPVTTSDTECPHQWLICCTLAK